ncbi:MAG: hypothetical protein IT293_22080 [Deltaproteobacteria bacterium]|nr:hypothetical protein [Deltaproteobacteria bacterium]
MRATAITRLDALPCPLCGDALERGAGREGLVWVCRACRGGAVTLPILRRFAPRPLVNHLWQTALHHGRSSPLRCPACLHRFTEVASVVSPRVLACVRCYWVWLDCDALDALTSAAMPLPPPPPPRRLASRRR